MQRVRIQLALMFGWLFVLFNIERLHAPINVASFVYVLAAVGSVVVVVAPALRRVSLAVWIPVGILLVLAGRLAGGYPIVGGHLPVVVTEAVAVTVTWLLSWKVATTLGQFERAAHDAMLGGLNRQTPSLETVQRELYREVRRARQHGRPLTMLAIARSRSGRRLAVNRFLEDLQREAIDNYVDARLVALLAEQTNDCDIITQCNRHFVVMLPETDPDRAEHLKTTITREAEVSLGVDLTIGAASFPDEEVTLVGLLQRAEERMRPPNEPNRHAAGAVNGNGRTGLDDSAPDANGRRRDAKAADRDVHQPPGQGAAHGAIR